jgi:probable rRNA maturation factor
MSLTLEWSNEQTVADIPERWIPLLTQLLNIAGEMEGVTRGEVALSFVDDETIRRLNRDYRGLDKPTDVLSFSMREMGDGETEIVYVSEDGEGGGLPDDFAEPLGDIVISVPRALAQSEEYGHSPEREIGFLFVHGFLHLLGYDHQDEASEREMFRKQEQILQKAGLTR